ncbi:hypothetical protein OED01_02635 [Microbacterium sp. M28]|uniref:hypothetical protein n=1 Tax=Microbacterium sp. M28 TaxID=2962064 RepID=UPI0021F43350|nr:hypothetical protein [Microbacterium sp. M28]UYO97648.1 hypothetical protein OED01_02635 [Microbacterium sp. M28]
MNELPDTIRTIVESAYGLGIADAFMIAVPLAILGVIAIAFIKNKPLSTKTAAEELREQAEESVIEIAEAEVAASLNTTGAIRIDGTQPSTGSVSVIEREDQERGR